MWRADVTSAAVAVVLLTAGSAAHLMLLGHGAYLQGGGGEVQKWAGELVDLRAASRREAREQRVFCTKELDKEAAAAKAAVSTALKRVEKERREERRSGAVPAGAGSGFHFGPVVGTLRGELPDRKQSLSYATNTVDKLLYELKNMPSPSVPIAHPPFNPLPLADQREAGLETKNLVIGVSSVNRRKNYLLDTLRNLIAHMSPRDKKQNRIVVLNGDTPPSKHQDIPLVREEFAAHIESGMLRIEENPEGHPELREGAKLTLRWGDSVERVRWRAKQVLDVALLMALCGEHTEYDYFLMLEDDVHAADSFPSVIRRCVDAGLSWRTDWTVASFYNPWRVSDGEEMPVYKFFGVIGQLFRTTDLPWIVDFLRRNFDESPLDWLFVDLLTKRGGKIIAHSPSLFQHQGVVSSLSNKVQPSRAAVFDEHPSHVC
eukprot:Hpha_TRINITY_DN22687_c0_g1::TRINITY_DN22687_c0_g1_i1::g.192719::m.192719/K00738/MGAT4A_B; alpha-1,3-mannosylglycoprotein beta-1,4-N-acetylglucosaminyltransferase A/B